MARKAQFGVTRNGEHVKLFDTRAEALEHVEKSKRQDQEWFDQGWSSTIDSIFSPSRYHIETVKWPWAW